MPTRCGARCSAANWWSCRTASRDTDTTALAHVLLPAAGWGEKDGTVTNSERRISRQRAFLPLPGEAQPGLVDRRARSRSAWASRRLRLRRPRTRSSTSTRALSAAEQRRRRAPSTSAASRGLRRARLRRARADAVAGAARSGTPAPRACSSDGRFFHRGRPRALRRHAAARAASTRPTRNIPLVLNTGRIRDQWHTMTRTGTRRDSNAHVPEPYVDMHAQDALLVGAREGELARVSTRWGSLVARAAHQRRNAARHDVRAIHWNGAVRVGRARRRAGQSGGRSGVRRAGVQAHAGARRAVPRRLARLRPQPRAARRARRDLVDADARRAASCATRSRAVAVGVDASDWARRSLGATDADADWIEYEDRAPACIARRCSSTIARSLRLLSRGPTCRRGPGSAACSPNRGSTRATASACWPASRRSPSVDTGPTVCSCFGVGRNTIFTAIREHALSSAEQVGTRTRAGTNCGSCVPEIRTLLASR